MRFFVANEMPTEQPLRTGDFVYGPGDANGSNGEATAGMHLAYSQP